MLERMRRKNVEPEVTEDDEERLRQFLTPADHCNPRESFMAALQEQILREAQRQHVERRADAGSRDGSGSGMAMHVRSVETPHLSLRMADIERLSDERAAEVTRRASEVLRRHADARRDD
jgi:hypothetical protein